MQNIQRLELVKMSPKGQLVVPQSLRKELGYSPSEFFMPFKVRDGIFFKKVKMPKVKFEFKALSEEIEGQFKENKISKKTVEEAIKWARKRK